MNLSYKDAGVNLEAGDETVNRIKSYAKSTFTRNVLSGIGLFGSFYELDVTKYKKPVLVSSVDGVGTKLKVAIEMNKHDTIGQDLVNHCVNDIAVCGATPLYFLDYLAFGKLNPDVAEQIVKGFTIACLENSMSLVGGETAEMPGLYDESDYDLSGTIVGVVEKDEVINGSDIEQGDVLIGFKSNGLHTNGYSLARKVLQSKFALSDKPALLSNNSVGEELLQIHKSYLPIISKIKNDKGVAGFSHITGGGIIGNTKRIMPNGLTLDVNWKSWETLPIFNLIQETGSIVDEEMRKVFNLGIGLIAVVKPNSVDTILQSISEIDESGIVIGTVK